MRRIQPESIAKLEGAAEDAVGTTQDEMLSDASQNVRQLAKACIKAPGGHAEHSVKLS